MNRLIKRIVVLITYIGVSAVLLFSLASLFAYLNTGAERSKMLHTSLIQNTNYTPEVAWVEGLNEGRPMDDQTLIKVEQNYLQAWEVRNIALKTNDSTGVEDHFTEKAQHHVADIIKYNASQGQAIETTSLSHRPEILFFSEDGQMIVLRDHMVKEYVRIMQGNLVVANEFEQNSYLVTLLLEDGFWRIRHLVKEKVEQTQVLKSARQRDQELIKGINYYPQATPWDMFGDQFDINIIHQDFKLLEDAGLNTVRIFVQHRDFGRDQVSESKLEKLRSVLDVAKATKLKVLVTLFDFYGDYSVLNWTLDQKHAAAIVNAVKNHEALFGWDIKNEPNLDFDSRGKNLVLDWLENMIEYINRIDQKHPITIGWSNTESAQLLSDQVDFVSFHYYKDLKFLKSDYQVLKDQVQDRPIVLGEFGLSSYRGLWNPFGSSKKTQAKYHQEAQQLINELDLPFLSWTLYDFKEVPTDVVGSLPWRRQVQKRYGFIDKSGQKKPAFTYISSYK